MSHWPKDITDDQDPKGYIRGDKYVYIDEAFSTPAPTGAYAFFDPPFAREGNIGPLHGFIVNERFITILHEIQVRDSEIEVRD